MLQEEVHRLKMLCEAQQETVPEEVQHQLADAEMALTRALEECRAALCQNRQVRCWQPSSAYSFLRVAGLESMTEACWAKMGPVLLHIMAWCMQT